MVDEVHMEKTTYAPIIIFCYRRPDHLLRTLESLMRCDGFDSSRVVVFGDGPKNPEQIQEVDQTRKIARSLLGDRAEYHFREQNAGLARSIIEGVSDVVGRFGRAIVIEDDLELAPGFLTYMNCALECFEDDDRVWQVSGYMFDVPEFRLRSQALFLPMTSSWGWGTWKRAWKQFDPMATGWERVNSDSVMRFRFNLDGAYDYASMLNQQMAGKIDSWAIRWYWTVFRADGMVLFPPISLISNHGFDGSGSHGSGLLRNFSDSSKNLPYAIPSIHVPVVCCQEDFRSVVLTINKLNRGQLRKILDKLVGFFR